MLIAWPSRTIHLALNVGEKMPFVSITEVEPPWIFGISALLGNGSIILPGNWCRIIAKNATRPAADARSVAMLRYERILEEQRALLMPFAPSRMESVFVSPNIDSAQAFAQVAYNRTDVLYFVEPIHSFERVFIAQWSLYNSRDLMKNAPGRPDRTDKELIAHMQTMATRYWIEPAIASARELLIPCGVRIIGIVDL
jgi:hypothetical protein